MQLTKTFALLAHLWLSSAFSVNPLQGLTAIAARLPMSEPPHLSNYDDDSVVIEIESQVPTSAGFLVSNVTDLIPATLRDVNREVRRAINEAIYKLEAANPTPKPTMSSLLNGVWELRHVGGYDGTGALKSPTRPLSLFVNSGGYSPGVFALGLAQKLPSQLIEVCDLEIEISRDQPRVEAKVAVKVGLGNAESVISVKALLEVASDIRLTETYDSAKVMDRSINFPTQFRYSRDLYVTYLDEEVLIVRDNSGVPEILIRKQTRFSQH